MSTSYIFSQKFENRFFIIVIYVDGVNIIGTLEELPTAIDWFKK